MCKYDLMPSIGLNFVSPLSVSFHFINSAMENIIGCNCKSRDHAFDLSCHCFVVSSYFYTQHQT